MLFDISRKLENGMVVWPGDSHFALAQMMAISRGDTVNLTTLTMSVHSGSHIDAPFHFSESGQTVDELDLAPYWGKAQLITVDKQAGPGAAPVGPFRYQCLAARKISPGIRLPIARTGRLSWPAGNHTLRI